MFKRLKRRAKADPVQPCEDPRVVQLRPRIVRLRAAIEAFASEAGVALPASAVHNLAQSVERKPAHLEAIVLETIRETIMHEVGKAP